MRGIGNLDTLDKLRLRSVTRDALDLWHREFHAWPICQTRQVMIHVLENHVDARFILTA